MKNISQKYWIKNFTGLVLGLILTAFQINAQTGQPRPTPTPVDSNGVEIISRAGEFSTESIINPERLTSPNPQIRALEEKVDNFLSRINELSRRITTLESTEENQYDRQQKRLLLNLDILSRAEQRAENLRKQLFDLIEKESEIRLRLEQLETELRPEMIDRVIAFAGTLRPEELRAARRKTLETEQTNLQNLLTEITNNKINLQENVQRADALVEKLRSKLEKEIDEALADEEEQPNF